MPTGKHYTVKQETSKHETDYQKRRPKWNRENRPDYSSHRRGPKPPSNPRYQQQSEKNPKIMQHRRTEQLITQRPQKQIHRSPKSTKHPSKHNFQSPEPRIANSHPTILQHHSRQLFNHTKIRTFSNLLSNHRYKKHIKNS
jgi:hypothetical protein